MRVHRNVRVVYIVCRKEKKRYFDPQTFQLLSTIAILTINRRQSDVRFLLLKIHYVKRTCSVYNII